LLRLLLLKYFTLIQALRNRMGSLMVQLIIFVQ